MQRVAVSFISGVVIESVIAGLYQVFNVISLGKITEAFVESVVSYERVLIYRHKVIDWRIL